MEDQTRKMRPLLTVVTRKQIAEILRCAPSTLNSMAALTTQENECRPLRHQQRRKAPVQVCYRLGEVHAWLTRVCSKYTSAAAAELMMNAFQIEGR